MKLTDLIGAPKQPKPVEFKIGSGTKERRMWTKRLARADNDPDSNLIQSLNRRMIGAQKAAEESGNERLVATISRIRKSFAADIHDQDYETAAFDVLHFELVTSPDDSERYLMAGESRVDELVVGAPRGSQKDARLSPGTDDPSKYMRGGEWEAYKTPQGIGSGTGKDVTKGTASKAMGSVKKRKKAKNESVYNKKDKFNYKWEPGLLPDPDGAPGPATYDAPKPGEDGIRHIVAFGVRDEMKNKAHKGDTRRRKQAKEANVIGLGGAGADNDITSRKRDATTINIAKNKDDPIAGNEAPLKFVKRSVKKSVTDTKGGERMDEAIHRTRMMPYNAEYEVKDDRDENTIGVANINNGVIETLAVRNDFKEDFNGHILSKLLGTIVRDADAANANLAIKLDDPNDIQHKRFLERFGFRETSTAILKRTAGSVTPPSVPTARI